ncbi:hypothetical protein Agub_g3457 [Astrephomene gubernaculifera]|uniref:Uncharacterized protein n=1 Tax=Astrephomene gubernaculifera TaxID=47775 RepID=A0AAD3DIQ6_9CHLO|nr:hypothetical protein Agub_g3457 [Astrephomene gubernaculifera]
MDAKGGFSFGASDSTAVHPGNDHALSTMSTARVIATAVIDPACPAGSEQRQRRLVLEPLGVWVKDGHIIANPQDLECAFAQCGSLAEANPRPGSNLDYANPGQYLLTASSTAPDNVRSLQQSLGEPVQAQQLPSRPSRFGMLRNVGSSSGITSESPTTLARFQPYLLRGSSTAIAKHPTPSDYTDLAAARQLPSPTSGLVLPSNPLPQSAPMATSPYNAITRHSSAPASTSYTHFQPAPRSQQPSVIGNSSIPASASALLSSQPPSLPPSQQPSQPQAASQPLPLAGRASGAGVSELWHMWASDEVAAHEGWSAPAMAAGGPRPEASPLLSPAPGLQANATSFGDVSNPDNTSTASNRASSSSLGANCCPRVSSITGGGPNLGSGSNLHSSGAAPLEGPFRRGKQQYGLGRTSRPLSPWSASCAEVWEAAFGENPARAATVTSTPAHTPTPGTEAAHAGHTQAPQQLYFAQQQQHQHQQPGHAPITVQQQQSLWPQQQQQQHLSPQPEGWPAAPAYMGAHAAVAGAGVTGGVWGLGGAGVMHAAGAAMPYPADLGQQPLAYQATPPFRRGEWQ